MTYRLYTFKKFIIILLLGVFITLMLLLPLFKGNSTVPIWFFGFLWAVILFPIFIGFVFNLSSLKIFDGILYVNKVPGLNIEKNTYRVRSLGGGYSGIDSFRNRWKFYPIINVEIKNIKSIKRVFEKELIKNLKKSNSIEAIEVVSSKNVVEIVFKKPLEFKGGVGGTIVPLSLFFALSKIYLSVIGVEEFIKDIQKQIK